MRDQYDREINYMRLSVTDRCNLRCRYCMPEEGVCKKTHEEMLTEDEMIAAVEAGASLGITKLRITGGEPLLYPLGVLTETLHAKGLEIFLETSGSHPFSGVFDWVCLSPKRQQPPLEEAYGRADELKVIVESEADFEWAERNAARVGEKCLLYLQPEWSVAERVMPAMVEYAKAHPRWNISIQTHKYMHIP